MKSSLVSKSSAALFAAAIIFCTAAAGAATLTLRYPRSVEKIEARVGRKISLPIGYHEGLFVDRGDIWIANGRNGKIMVVDRATGSQKTDIEPVGTFTEGMTRGPGGDLFVTDWDLERLYRVKREADRLVPTAELAQFTPAHPAGVTWAIDRFYVLTWTRGLGTRFDIVALDERGSVIEKVRLRGIMDPSQLWWDGAHLWISSWYNRRVYRVDPARWEVTGYFIAPVPLVTGIAWDGASFWVTGTYDDLYEIQIPNA